VKDWSAWDPASCLSKF